MSSHSLKWRLQTSCFDPAAAQHQSDLQSTYINSNILTLKYFLLRKWPESRLNLIYTAKQNNEDKSRTLMT